jgi:hypothetical protein
VLVGVMVHWLEFISAMDVTEGAELNTSAAKK